ncbi:MULTISPECIES: DUF6182 family protein [Kitasatospora]|uniref:Uncharacterized protein n=1 Tax=Kitasatospora setae (strain ATCC 33774 / DSM 43861 / JCM 3304 / KCC A-0304 / NBRC 14216 / KM-6054) TaxID=452652 RepID=E4MZ20_KITSK|nr:MULTISPECIES: DUF6182 family protein [Kitasatospora]BAJ25913.1 hypothetical protein KSE_00610t [Kitasatospora setae KM-6054]BAJ33365.1 hypothetical protein KSE_76130t [Kitasatospora setae KM-6054]
MSPSPSPVLDPAQDRLRHAAAGRVRRARPDLAARYDLDTTEGLLEAQQAVATRAGDGAGEEGTLAAVVVRHVDLAAWVRSTCEFALALDPALARPWRRSFTRTVFLAGNPDNLRERFPFAHTGAGAAWTPPGPDKDTAALRRLLKTFDGPAGPPARPATDILIPAGPGPHGPGGRAARHRDLYLATAGCTLSEALVHLNHILVEAVLDGLIAPGERLTLRQIPRLTGIEAPFAALRVVAEPHRRGRLKAAAALTEEIPPCPQ